MSGTLRTGTWGDRNYHLAIDWKVTSQSVTNNTSTLYYRIYADNSGNSGTWVAYYNIRVTIEGQTVYTGNNINGYKGETLKTGYVAIKHNDDGNKNVLFNASADFYYPGSNTRTINQNVSLSRIDRGIYNFKLGTGWEDIEGAKTVTFSKYNSNARVQIVFAWWDYVKKEKTVYWNIHEGASGNKIADNYRSGLNLYLTDNIKNEMKKSRPDNWKGYGYVQAWVFIGDRRIQTLTLEVPGIILSRAKPNLTFTASFTGQNQSLLGSNTRGVKGVHKLKLSINAKGNEYATIKHFEINFDGKKTITKKSTVELTATRAGKKTVTVKVVDSRGWTKEASKTVEVIEYRAPIINYRVFRTENGIENPVGDTARITGIVKMYPVQNTSGKHVNEPFWKLSLDGTRRSTASVMYSTSIPVDSERRFTIEYGDKFTTASISGVIPLGKAPLVIGQDAVGINTVPPENGKGLYLEKDSKLHIGHKYFLEFVPSDPKLGRNDALYIARDDRRYGLALVWNKLYFIKDYKYYEIFKA